MHSTPSHRQLPQGAPSTTSHLTFRARQDTQARAARLLVILTAPLGSVVVADRFLGDDDAFSAEFGDIADVVLGGVVGVAASSVCDSGERIEFVSSTAIFATNWWGRERPMY